MDGKTISCKRVMINFSTIQPKSNFGNDAFYRSFTMHLHVMFKREVKEHFQSQTTSTCPLKFNQNLISVQALYIYNFNQCYRTGTIH